MHSELGLGSFKKLVAETISSNLEPVRKRFEEVMRKGEGKYLDEVERMGARKARESAEETMSVVREAVGL